MSMLVHAVALLAFLLLTAGMVGAQDYPAKPVRVVIPWPPGGANDIVGRIVFQKMSEQLGQQFVIDNRGGASGTIGSDLVAKGPPDGYTVQIVYGSSGNGSFVHLAMALLNSMTSTRMVHVLRGQVLH